jgi:Calcineurin-like phosphoesterase
VTGSVRRGMVVGLLVLSVSAGVLPDAVRGATLIAYPPTIRLDALGRLGKTSVPLDVTWPAATLNAGVLARYELQVSRDSGPWTYVYLAKPRARNAVVKQPAWSIIRFRVRAVDGSANASPWAESEPVWMTTAQESDEAVDLSAGWQIATQAAAFQQHRARAAVAGATATFSFAGGQVGWVSRLAPNGGTASVSIDGRPPTVVDLYRGRASTRRLVFVASGLSAGEHTLSITTLRSARKVDIDAFVVVADPMDETLVGAGDIAQCLPDAEGNIHPTQTSAFQTAQMVQAVDGIVFAAGDNVYPTGSLVNYGACYDPTWGTLKARTRPVPGNHEYLSSPSASGYFNYFGSVAGEPGKGWYRYEAGTWRIYALNSECKPSTTCLEQLDWLAADLASEPHLCTLAVWHRPRWGPTSATDWPRMDAIWRLLAAAGAEVVINGHNHAYARWTRLNADGTADPNGMLDIVVGTGGAGLYDYPTFSSLIEVHDSATHGVLRLDLRPGSYGWEFLPLAGSTFSDSGSADCR